jgi:adenylate kinase family enzyme
MFTGAPGVGKSSIAKSLVQTSDIKFAVIDVRQPWLDTHWLDTHGKTRVGCFMSDTPCLPGPHKELTLFTQSRNRRSSFLSCKKSRPLRATEAHSKPF